MSAETPRVGLRRKTPLKRTGGLKNHVSPVRSWASAQSKSLGKSRARVGKPPVVTISSEPRRPLPKKRPTPRTRRCVCGERTAEKKCLACGERRGVKRTTLKKRADTLWSEIVRSRGKCEAAEWCAPQGDGRFTWIACGGGLQGAHGFPRTYYATRWTILNGFCLCAGHHRWFTSKPIEWTAFMLQKLGALPFEELRRIALANASQPDYIAIIRELKSQKRVEEGS